LKFGPITKYLTKIVWCYNVYFGPLFFIQEELGQRSPILKAQTRFGSVLKTESVARDICRGVERGKFLITHGFDGFLLGVIATGMSPVYHWATLITEVVCVGLFRLVGCVYIALFYNIVRRETKKAKKQD
jgi:hypothetical protein